MHSSFFNWPSFTDEEADAVTRVLLSNKVNYWTGNECKNFETEFAKFSDVKYAIAVANGTVALDLAFKALGIGNGDEVIVTSRTFIASVSSIINAGACPVFVDVSLNTQNISPEAVATAITERTRAILCVHLAGWPCDMDPILDLADEFKLFVVEDCAQAHGAVYKGKSVGSIGDVGCWSFCQDKIMTTGGEGGMVTTNNKTLWSKMWSFKDHGKSWEAANKINHSVGFKWLHDSFGTNFRMTEMQAAIGRIQLKRMPIWHKKRLSNANKIWNAARKNNAFIVPQNVCSACSPPQDKVCRCEHAAYKCYLFVDGDEQDRNLLMDKINQQGVPCFSGSCSEVYLEKAFEGKQFQPVVRLPNAQRLGETSLAFFCHPTLSDENIEKTCEVIEKV